MILPISALVLGIAALVLSADKFIEGSASVARHLGLNPLLIGMVVVGFGTSAPEILVSIMSSLEGNPGIALGNAFGSNIGNIGLILGITSIMIPLTVESKIIRHEMPLLLGIIIFLGALLVDGSLSQNDGWFLMAAFVVFLVWSIVRGREGNDDLGREFKEKLDDQQMPMGKSLVFLVLGLIVLIGSSKVMVWGAVSIAHQFGVSDLIIGLTVVAIGTSLPELASSIIAARKGEHDIAIGNVVGSNIFNALVVTGLAGIISPLEVPPEALTRDYPVMIGMTLLMFVFGFGFKKAGRINRIEGGIFVALYIGYTAYLVIGA